MRFAQYRTVLGIRGVPSVTLLMALLRLPISAVPLVVTLHVVQELGLGYAAAGTAAAVITIGTAIAAPIQGQISDRWGIRRLLTSCVLGSAVFWFSAPFLPYALLVPACLLGGLADIPTTTISRQALAALVPEAERRTAYTLDSISWEIGYMVGPALGAVVATMVSGTVAMLGVGAIIVVAGSLLWITNPPIRTAEEESGRASVRIREWLTGPLVSLLVIAVGLVTAFAAVDVSVIAALRAGHQVMYLGWVTSAGAVASICGGLAFGTMRRAVSPRAMAAVLCGAILLAVVATGSWWALLLALLPASAMCAPTMTAIGEDLTRLSPPSVRGLVIGLQGSAYTVGATLGAPLAGVVADHFPVGWAFGAAAAVGVGMAVLAVGLNRIRRPATASTPAAEPVAR